MQIQVKLPSFEGIGAGQTATCRLPIGRRYHELQLVYSGVTLAQMTEIRIIANQKVIHRYSATERDVMNQFFGLTAAAGILRLPFDRLFLKQRQAEEVTALNTGSKDKNGRFIGSLHVEIDVAAAAVGTALALYATQSNAVAGGPGVVGHIRKYSRTAAGAGEYEVSDLHFNTPTAQAINSLFINDAGNLNGLVIERGLYKVFERDTALNELIQSDHGRVPQTNWWVYDPAEKGYGGEPLDLVGYSDFRLRLDMAAGATMPIIVEYLGQLGD
ncbi:hypothetical protein ABIE65_005031 [Constrictibacter sp. MBR-5]|uniref:major capsid protein P2 n=1 Tax=Constrictibacter sp. MBR-5 TaxID=3156467 RepID=UPI00339AE540